ncbi:hypothetical protein [Micromonospora endophytica]|uniref:Uncharacterized protein n=1 Tax=Micromonospora endophytica TaxID=515350 RepID=A0A2W2D6Q3_9ACTN|nr:hypothetical protein [Micromonospora endophytica]PZF99408.1 hypothetical protein C1I93_05990 [Micromonospora endophytica]RIW42883.1 hypothetical protein D3H59_21905 [Micromonospora endophytica]BCJ61599.1 hypothetical protein Jiend_50210 [Micromonospora endophytica]
MNALVGKFEPGARRFQARRVALEGQPSGTLAQMRVIWAAKFRRDTAAMVEALLGRDWSVLAYKPWPEQAVAERRPEWAYVRGLGLAANTSEPGPALAGDLGGGTPTDDGWAYLWEHEMGALHVYAARGGRWHHLATLPADVWAGMTEQLVVDVEARWCWLDQGEDKAA